MHSFADEIAEILDPDDLGVTATHATVGTFNGVFTAAFAGPAEVESVSPSILCKSSEISALVHGDTLTLAGTGIPAGKADYKVRGLEPVEVELTRITLEAQ